MIVYAAPTDTERPEGPPSDEWKVLGAADDSTLPADGDELLRLRLHEKRSEVTLPVASAAVWVPDLGVYQGDVSIAIDRTDVITISTAPLPASTETESQSAAHADRAYDGTSDAPLADLDDDD